MEEIEFHRALHRPGTMVDAGAHEGRMTLLLAQLPTSWVVAFEPVPPLFARLQRVMAAAWSGETPSYVTLRREALSDRSGTTMIAAPRVNGKLQDEWASTPGSRPLKHSSCLFSDWTMPIFQT
jgi:FkbM family methyltransferase